MSQPSPRTFGSPTGVAGDVMRATASGDSTRGRAERAAAEQHAREIA